MKYDGVKAENSGKMDKRWRSLLDREVRTRREMYSMVGPAEAAVISENNLRLKLYAEELKDAVALMREASEKLQSKDFLGDSEMAEMSEGIIQAYRKVEDIIQELGRFL